MGKEKLALVLLRIFAHGTDIPLAIGANTLPIGSQDDSNSHRCY